MLCGIKPNSAWTLNYDSATLWYCVCPSVHGWETWTLLKANERKLEAFHMSCQRQILGLRWYQFVSNASVINQTGQDSLCSRISSRHLTLFGRVCSLTHTTLSLVVKARSGRQPTHWRHSRGRPHHSWTTQIELDSGQWTLCWPHVAVLAIPGPHRLNHTVDTALTSRGTWLVIVWDGGRNDPLPV